MVGAGGCAFVSSALRQRVLILSGNPEAKTVAPVKLVAAGCHLGYNTRPPRDNGEDHGEFQTQTSRCSGEKAGREKGRTGEETGCSKKGARSQAAKADQACEEARGGCAQARGCRQIEKIGAAGEEDCGQVTAKQGEGYRKARRRDEIGQTSRPGNSSESKARQTASIKSNQHDKKGKNGIISSKQDI
jgi:hypothetical protein